LAAALPPGQHERPAGAAFPAAGATAAQQDAACLPGSTARFAMSEYAPTPTAARITLTAISVLSQGRRGGAAPQAQPSTDPFA